MSISVDSISEKIFDNFKKITPALVAIALLTGMILFLSDSVLKKMALDNLPDLWNRIIGLIFLLSVAIIVTLVVFSIISKNKNKRMAKKIRENLKNKLKKLSPRQKTIVFQLLHSEDKTIALDKNSGDTIYLVNNWFLYMPEQAFTLGWNNEMILTYVPHPWLLELYNDEPELFN